MEFKGTEGKWFLNKEARLINSDNGMIAHTCMMPTEQLDERLPGESWLSMRERTAEQRKSLTETIPMHNALLISKAPEMLELLEEIVTEWKCGNEDNFIMADLIDKSEQLIKEATEL